MTRFMFAPGQVERYNPYSAFLVSCVLTVLSFYAADFSTVTVSNVQLLSISSGMIVAVAYVYGNIGIVGASLGLFLYYSGFNFIPNGIGFIYTLTLVVGQLLALSFYNRFRGHPSAFKFYFCFCVFVIPGISAITICLLASELYPFEKALNLFLVDSIGVLLTAPLITLCLLLAHRNRHMIMLLSNEIRNFKSELGCKITIIGLILSVLFYASQILHPYLTYLLLLPLAILAVFKISELTQIILIVTGYTMLIHNYKGFGINELNTKLTVFYIFSLIVYIVLEYKINLRREIETHKQHLYFDNASHLGTFQKLAKDTTNLRGFLVAAVDLSAIFKYPTERREQIIQAIACVLKRDTFMYDSSYILYDINALAIISEYNIRSISRLEKLPDQVNSYLKACNLNVEFGRIYYCHCPEPGMLRQRVNLLHLNAKLTDPLSNAILIDCDNTSFEDYLGFFYDMDEENIAILHQRYQSSGTDETYRFEILSRFSYKGMPLETERVFLYARKLSRLEELEGKIVCRTLKLLSQMSLSNVGYASINFSPDFLTLDSAIDRLISEAERLKVPFDKLCIELVETGSIEDPAKLADNLCKLKMRGAGLRWMTSGKATPLMSRY